MEVVIVKDAAEAGPLVAGAIARVVERKPTMALGLATGSSPLPVYDELVRRHHAGELDLSMVQGFLLDEYLGLPPDHPECYRVFIQRVFTSKIGFRPDQLHGPDVMLGDVPELARRYEDAIKAVGGIDLQLLGIGTDGHIGFNEPVSSLSSRTRIKTLTRSTREDNARFFDGDLDAVPTHVITQGIGTILEAQHLVLIASGENKAEAVAATIEGPVRALVPASALQLHRHATVIIDEAAASSLTLGNYYRETWEAKPAWQTI